MHTLNPQSPIPNPAVLITGAAKRLGREIALYLAAQGYDIALHYHTSKTQAEWVRDEITALGRQCSIFHADLSDITRLAPLVAEVFQAMPHCRHLVNNAAVFKRGGFLDAPGATPEEHMAVNFRAPLILSRVFAKTVKDNASITNLLDARIHETKHAYFFYLLSKKALAEFTLMAAAELAPRIRVNGACPPSVMETSDGLHPAPTAPHPTPQDVAKAAHALIASEKNGKLVFVGAN